MATAKDTVVEDTKTNYRVLHSAVNVFVNKEKKEVATFVKGAVIALDPAIHDIKRLLRLGAVEKTTAAADGEPINVPGEDPSATDPTLDLVDTGKVELADPPEQS